MALQLIWKFCKWLQPRLQSLELQLVADSYIKILCSRFCNWLQPRLQPPELQLFSCRAIFNLDKRNTNKEIVFHRKLHICIFSFSFSFTNIYIQIFLN